MWLVVLTNREFKRTSFQVTVFTRSLNVNCTSALNKAQSYIKKNSWHGIATSYYEHVKMKLIQCNEMSLGFRIRAMLSSSIPAHVSFVMFFLAAKLKIQVCISLTDHSDKTSPCACNSQRSPLGTSWSYYFGVTCHNQLSGGRTARRANYSIYVERLAIWLQKHGFAFSVMCRPGTLPL